MRRVARLALALAALAACSPYDPSLPRTPFLCGSEEPRCPDGYACVADDAGRMVCRAAGTAPDAGTPRAAAPDRGDEHVPGRPGNDSRAISVTDP